MHRPRLPALLAALAWVAAGLTSPPASAVEPGRPGPYGSTGGDWKLRFEDRFEGDRLDPSKWSSGYGWGAVAERTYGYCDPAHNTVAGGVLTQHIERRAQGGRAFTIGCVNSRNRFSQLFGYWEARIRVVGCRGGRSAFWAKPNTESWPPELDVVEVLGDRRKEAQLTIHWRERGRHTRSKGVADGPVFHEDFHVFGAEWTPTETIWFVDGFELYRTRAGARFMDDGGPFYTMLEAQVIDPDSYCGIYPSFSRQQIDYVRIWSR